MIKIIRFNKKKVISFLGLKKNKNFTFNKWVESITNFKNTFIDQKCLLEKIFDRRGFLLYRKFPLFINYIHKKFIVFRDRTFELSSKLDKKFILSYYGYYLNCLDEDLFRRLYFLPKFNYNLKLKYERDSFDLTKLSVDLLYYLEMIKSMIRRQQIKHRRLLNLRTQLLGKYDFNVSLITSNRLDLWNWSKSDLRNFNTIRVPHT